MTKRAGKPVKSRSSVQYLNVDLTKAYRADLLKWLEGAPDLWDCIEKVTDSGLRFGASYDAYNECMQATLTQMSDDTPGSQTVVLVGRGGNLKQAIEALFFKYFVVLDGEMVDLDRKNGRGETDWM